MDYTGSPLTLHADGSASIAYEDHGVDFLGGADCEVTYLLDASQFSALLKSLGCPSKLMAEEYIVEKFGSNLDKLSFGEFCNSNSIKYKKNVWIG